MSRRNDRSARVEYLPRWNASGPRKCDPRKIHLSAVESTLNYTLSCVLDTEITCTMHIFRNLYRNYNKVIQFVQFLGVYFLLTTSPR